jgi:hypothetical protein
MPTPVALLAIDWQSNRYTSLMAFMFNAATDALAELIAKRFGPPPAPLAVRAQEVSDALTKAGALMEELRTEVDARTALIDSLAARTQDAERRSADALLRADLNEEQAKAVDAYLDKALQVQLGAVERKAKRREWGLATLGRTDSRSRSRCGVDPDRTLSVWLLTDMHHRGADHQL